MTDSILMVRKEIRRIVIFTDFFSLQNEFLKRKGVFHDETKNDQNSKW